LELGLRCTIAIHRQLSKADKVAEHSINAERKLKVAAAVSPPQSDAKR
jgi:hypothetical protein